MKLEHAIEILQCTPATLQALLGGLSEFWTHSNYGPDTFSPFDVVGHLIYADKTNFPVRIKMILEQGESAQFPPFDRYAMYEISKGKSMPELLREFADGRAKNLADVRALNITPDQLELRGSHPDFGIVTLGQQIATWAVHDLNHLHQIAKSMAFQYRDAVGPWRAYLSILPDSH